MTAHAHQAETRPANPTPWWYWTLALVGVPIATLAAFVGLGTLFGWSESGAWMAGLVSGAAGIAAMVAAGRWLGIDRFWTGLGVFLACVATPAWGIGVIYALLLIYCSEGCFN